MLRKLKQQVTQAVNGVNSHELRHEPLIDESDTISSSEGFLCPVCMHSFTSPDELQAHFQVHANAQQVEEQKVTNSSSSTSIGNNGFSEPEVIHLELDIKELKSQLHDEKRYSTELKKELHRLHSLIANQSQVPEGEVPYLMQQVQMLEAGKALATERLLEMEKETSALNRQIEQVKDEKVGLIKKIGELSNNLTSKTDEIEEKIKEKTVLGDELVRYRQEIQNLEAEVGNLQKQLDQRPSEDDVNVLRKELIHAQQLMDTITQEREEEIKEHINTIRNTEQDRKRLTCETANLKSNIEELENTIAKFQGETKNFPEQIDSFKKDWEEKTAASNQRIADAFVKIDGLENILSECRRKIVENAVDQKKLSKLEDSKKSLAEISKENIQLKEELQQRGIALEEALSGVQKIEKVRNDLKDKIDSLTVSLNEQKQILTEKEMLISKKEETITECREEIEQLKRHISKLETSLSEASTVENNLKRNLNEAKAKEELLMQKISEGEGAEKLAMEQMHQEKTILEKTVNDLNERLKSLKISHENAISEHEKSWKEKCDTEKKAFKEVENELGIIRAKYVSADEENKKVLERCQEMEKNHREAIDELKAALEARNRDMEALKSECAHLTEMLEDKIQTIEEKDKMVETGRNDLRSAVEKLAQMEEKTRQLDGELHETKAALKIHDDEYTKLEVLMKKLRSDLEEATRIKKQLELDAVEKKESFEKSIGELQKVLSKCEHEKSVLEESFQNVSQQLSAMGEECLKYRNEQAELQKDVEQKESLIKELQITIDNMTTEFSDIRNNCESQLSSLSDELIKLKEENTATVKAKEKEMELLKESMKAENAEKKEKYEKEIGELKISLQNAGESISTLKGERKEFEEKVNRLLLELEQERLNNSICVKDLQSQLKEMELEHVAAFTAKDKEYEAKLKDISVKLEAEKESYERSIYDLNEDLIRSKEESSKLLEAKDKEVATQLKTISKLDEQIRVKEAHLSEIGQEMARTQNELRSKEEGRLNLENRVSELNEQTVKLRKELDEQEKCTLQMKSDFENEMSLLKESLEQCKLDKEESLSEVTAQLEKEKSKLVEALKAVEDGEANLKEMKNDLEQARKDASELKTVRTELEKRKTEWLQEKRVLQERCLTAESDLEFERERAAVNKRNFDDVQTAVQELGRVNQHLQMDFAKHTSRKWLDDSQAINCHSCDKPFTLTNRKHHCRQCGQIFCAPCSSFTAEIASFKNPVRVCNACHEEIMHRFPSATSSRSPKKIFRMLKISNF